LNEQRLREVVSNICGQGLTRDQLSDIASRRLTAGNPMLSHLVGNAGDTVVESGGDARSFNRGAVLGLHLIDEASEGGFPEMGVGSIRLAAQYRTQRLALENVRTAADDLLATQDLLSGAFDEALAGMPTGTERDMARFGAGITTLGALASMHFGGTGVEQTRI